jgi:UDP-glucose 4-epimerase
MNSSYTLLKQRIAIIGGHGYIGRHVFRRLKKIDIECWVVIRRSGVDDDLLDSSHIRFFEDGLVHALAGATTVIHAATASTPFSAFYNPKLELENINLINEILRSCELNNVNQLIYLSSGGKIYGELSSPAKEFQMTNPNCPYGLGKLASENLLFNNSAKTRLMLTILRLSNPYGGDQMSQSGQGVIPYLKYCISNNKIVKLYGNTVRDYIYIEDLVNGVISAVDHKEKFDIFNISTAVGTDLIELTKTIMTFYKYENVIERAELRPFDLSYNVLCNEKAKNKLNWNIKYSLLEGLSEYLSEK